MGLKHPSCAIRDTSWLDLLFFRKGWVVWHETTMTFTINLWLFRTLAHSIENMITGVGCKACIIDEMKMSSHVFYKGGKRVMQRFPFSIPRKTHMSWSSSKKKCEGYNIPVIGLRKARASYFINYKSCSRFECESMPNRTNINCVYPNPNKPAYLCRP